MGLSMFLINTHLAKAVQSMVNYCAYSAVVYIPPFSSQCYVADKIHCVWLVDGEMKVLFEYKEFEGPEQLAMGSAPIDLVINKELIQEYLDNTEHIPHIKQLQWNQLLDFK